MTSDEFAQELWKMGHRSGYLDAISELYAIGRDDPDNLDTIKRIDEYAARIRAKYDEHLAEYDREQAGREITRAANPVLWPQPDGTARTIESDDLRALTGYVEQRDGLAPMPGEQCVNKACGEDAAGVIEGDALCATHARMYRERLNAEHLTPDEMRDLDPAGEPLTA